MTEISRVDEGVAIDSYEFPDEVEKKEEIAPATINETNIPPGESEKILKAREIMQRAIAPNLRALDREQEIKIQLGIAERSSQKFALIKELLMIKLEAFNRTGLSIDEFIQEAKKCNLVFGGKNGDLKAELFGLYNLCLSLADEMQEEAKNYPYPSPYLQLFELEKETGFLLRGTSLLAKEHDAYSEILRNRLSGLTPAADSYNARPFYWLTALPGSQKILHYLEQENEKQTIEKVIDIIKIHYFNPLAYRIMSDATDTQDPLILLLPYIAKYASLDKIKPYFDERFKDLNTWDKDYRWIDLHCQAAEITISMDPEKAKNYLDKAEKEIAAKLWAYPFSFHRTAIEEARQKALQRIAEVKTKYKELVSS